MLSLFRSFLNTWAARAFFVVLVAAFGLWGVADVVRNLGHDTALATVGSQKIEPAEFQDAFRRQLAQVTRMMGGSAEPTPAIRKTVAEQSLERLIVQAAIAEEVDRLGIVVPDDSLRQAVFAMPAFRGKGGTFDHGIFETVLRNNDLNEGRFLELMRGDLGQRQLMDSALAGVSPPDTLLQQVYAFQRETRVGEVVDLPLAAAAAPPAPTEDDLQRQYDNDPAAYSAPAYRRIKLVVLSPASLARGIDVSPADIQAYYDAHKGEYVTEEKRSAQIIVAPGADAAKKLADQWQAGADWDAMQKAAADAGASAVALDDSTKGQFPSTDLANAVFAAKADTVTGPIKSDFGYQILRVTKVTAGLSRTLDEVKDAVRQSVAKDRAVDKVYASANKLDDALSAGTSFDDLPGDLGLIGVSGTVDAQGNTPDGEPAPIPGTPALRAAIVKAAFATAKGDPPHMVEGPDQSYYALQVDDVIEPKLKPFADVQPQLRTDWQEAQRRHEQNAQAAKLMTAAQAGGSLDDAATIAGLHIDKTPPVSRSGTVEHVPPQVQQALFRLNKSDTTMVETPDGFAVIRLTEIIDPDMSKDPVGASQFRDALTQALSQDVQIILATALRDRAQPRVNRTLLDSLSQ